MDMKVLLSETKLCACCMETHEVKVVRIQETNTFKGIPVEYEAEYFYCDLADEFYADGPQINDNDIRMKDAYRIKTGLLTSREICTLRAKYKISQSDLCTLLGWGGKTITRYESHQVQDKAHDTILRKLNQDPEWFLYLLIAAQESISAESFTKYLDTATSLFEKNQDYYLRKSIQAMYARFYGNGVYNGNVALSLDKVVDVIRYFSNHVTNLYKVKLMKLMWYADNLSYKIRNTAITGLIYTALPMGAVPIGHDSIIDLYGVEYEEIDLGDATGYRFRASGKEEYNYLSKEELEILNSVVSQLGKMTKSEIVSFMHKEQAYITTKPREIISFEYAKYLSI